MLKLLRTFCLGFMVFFISLNLCAQKTNEAEVALQAKLIEAQNLILINDVKAAEAIYMALLNGSDNATASFKLAELYFREGRFDDALSYAKKSLEWNDTEPWTYLLLADIQARTGHYNESANTIKRLVDLNAEEWQYWALYASMLEASGAEVKDIIRALDEQSKWQGETEDVYEKKFGLYIQNKDFDSAISINRQWLELNNHSEKALENMGSLYLINGDTEQAIKTYQRLLEINADNQEALRQISALRMEAIVVDDGADQYRIPIQGIINNNGLSTDEKIKQLLPFVQIYAQSEDTTLGNLLSEASQKLSNSNPSSGIVAALKADLLSIQGETESAVQAYKLAVDSEQSNFLLWQQLLHGLMDLEDYTDLNLYADQALDYFPAVLEFQYLKGLALHKLGQNEEAITLLNDLLILAPEDDENALKARELLNQLNN